VVFKETTSTIHHHHHHYIKNKKNNKDPDRIYPAKSLSSKFICYYASNYLLEIY